MVRRLLPFLVLLVAAVSWGALAGPALAGPPTGFSIKNVVTGLSQPSALDHAPDGRIFITQKTGLVRVWSGTTLTTFMDLRSEVNSYSDRGLLGIALDPQFATNRYVYLLFTSESTPGSPDTLTATTNTLIRVRESTTTPGTADLSTRQTVLSGGPQEGPWHSIGTVAFDGAGNVLVGQGDGTCYYPASLTACTLDVYNLDSMRGKILRFNPNTGAGSPSNPYYNAASPNSTRSRVLARGFRNPFRFMPDTVTGLTYVGDVGTSRWEELNVIPTSWSNADKDLNFGWPCYEGANGVSEKQPGYSGNSATSAQCRAVYSPAEGGTGVGSAAPAAAYSGSEPGGDDGNAIVVGPVYRAGTYPATYANKVFIADYARDRFQVYTPGTTTRTDFGTPGGWGNPVDIKVAPNGNLRYASISTGTIKEIEFAGAGNQPPTANATGTPTSGSVPLTVNFSSAGSTDPDPGDTLTFSWAWGDGTPPGSGASPSHTYTAPGAYTATLTVSDGRGGTAQDTVAIDAANTRPTISFTQPTAATDYVIDTNLPVTITASDAEDGPLTGSSVTWQVVTYHVGHQHFDDVHNGTTGSFTAPDHSDDSYLEFRATATDSAGASTSTAVEVHPRKVRNDITASVSPVTGSLDEGTWTNPYNWQSIPGSQHSVTAPTSVTSGGQSYAFQRWTTGGATVATTPTHDFTTPAAGVALRAEYQVVAANQNPTANAAGTPTTGTAPLAVAFSSAGSTDPDPGDTLTFSWDFGDGTPAGSGPSPNHTYAAAGTYTATLTVSDGNGGTAQDTVAITVSPAGGGTNLVTNPSFETNTAGWAASGTGAAVARVVVAGAPNGAAVAQITTTGTAAFGATTNPVASTAAGALYTASAYVKATGAASVGKSIDVSLRELAPGGALVQDWIARISLTAAWQPVSLQVLAARAGDSLQLRVLHASGTTGPSFQLDQASVTAPPPGAPPAVIPADNLTQNPSFEAGLAGWKGTGGTLTAIAAGDAPAGANVGRIAATAVGASYTVGADPVTVASTTAGTPYTAQAFIKSGAAGTNGKQINLRLRERTPGGVTVVEYIGRLNMSAAYQRAIISGTARGTGNTVDVRVSQDTAAAGDVFLVDAITLVPSGL